MVDGSVSSTLLPVCICMLTVVFLVDFEGHRHGDLAPLPDDFAGFPSGRGTIADTLCVWNRDRELKLATGKEGERQTAQRASSTENTHRPRTSKCTTEHC